MAWYSDEQYEMIKDSREKKSIAASAFKQRSHCGKSGCSLPSDFKTKKELKAMNGEIKSYRMNDPMSWDEFKELPNDLKVDYIQSLRDKFGAPDKYIAEMFGIPLGQFGLYLRDLKLEMVHDIEIWSKESFLAWRSGCSSELVKENDPEPVIVYERTPMEWAEFKTMSDDDKIEYLKWVRETFDTPEKEIAVMFGVNKATLATVVRALDCGVGKGSGRGKRNWDRSEFDAWCKGSYAAVVEGTEVIEPVIEEVVEEPVEPEVESEVESESIDIREEGATDSKVVNRAVPKFGQMEFECSADLALNTIAMILGSTNVKLSIHWDVVEEVV